MSELEVSHKPFTKEIVMFSFGFTPSLDILENSVVHSSVLIVNFSKMRWKCFKIVYSFWYTYDYVYNPNINANEVLVILK